MKNLAVVILLILLSLTTFAQKPKPTSKTSKNLPAAAKNAGNEKEDFEKAVAIPGAEERIVALQQFIKNYLKSEQNIRAAELITSARAALADEKLRSGDAAGGIALFKLAVTEAPKPVSDKLYNEVLVQIPTSLFVGGQRNAAVEAAKLIEEKAEGNADQILALATFYIGTENADEAKRLADKAISLKPDLPAAYQTLGLANRINFELEESANAYQKALELVPTSVVSKRSLAEMKRATGKSAEAVALYREILANDAADFSAQTGLILALFDAENKTEAESEMSKSLEQNPNNLPLLVGAAYWYAAHEQGDKAIELAEKAVAVEPRYTWAHIALARGLMQQKRLPEAEKQLLAARQYGDFPTLNYEIAAVRFQLGFYREAAEDLQKTFTVKDDLIETKLGGRVSKKEKNFIDLLALERRASIFEPIAADNSETADKLKSLLDFSQKLNSLKIDAETVSQATDDFVKGDDRMKIHRQLFAANRLLEKKSNLSKVLDLTKAAVAGVDAGLDVPNPAAAVLADELYESRKLAISRGELIIVPDVARQTLSNILRGRIEDLAGWTLFQTGKNADSVTRLKRAVSILPEKSSLWRASTWRLGTALETDGKLKDALDAYIKSYTNGEANGIRYGIIESLYQKINGSTDGLEARIGAKPASTVSDLPVQPEPTVVQNTEATVPKVEPTPEIKTPLTEPEKPSVAEAQPTPQVINQTTDTIPKTEPAPTPETKIAEAIQSEPKPEPKPLETVENQTPKPDTKSLFEPIIINVPKVETKAAKPAEEKKLSDENGESRPRVVIKNNIEPNAPCRLVANQETISIFANRGSLGVLVGFDDAQDFKGIQATSSSPGDVAVTSEPEIGALSNRAFFVVKSISRRTGEFVVTFEAACGKKEITVKVH